MSETTKDISLEEKFSTQFNSLESRINGAGQLPVHEVRKNALEAFRTLGFPGSKNEEYKYTPLQRILKRNFEFAESSATQEISKEEVAKHFIPGLKANNLVFVNGIFTSELSEVISPESEISIKNFAVATAENDEDVNTYFSKYADYSADALVALNTALAENGSVIKIENNKVIEAPVALYYFNTAENEVSVQPRNLIIAGKNSESTFLETHITLTDAKSFTNAVTEVVVNENTRLSYYKIQNNNEASYHVDTLQVWQDRTSVFNAYTFTLNGAMVRNNLNIAVDGEGVETHMYGLYLLNGSSHVDNHTAVDHLKPNSVSNELYKGILEDNSRGVFNGKVYVRQAAQKTNAFQSNKNILLSDESTVNTKPQLEIWADDVKCSHGCTTGQLDEEALFYLRSRGVGKERARVLLLYAYANEVLETIKLDALKDYLEDLISERLHKNF